jgi:D-galactarolactone cycloisomerase
VASLPSSPHTDNIPYPTLIEYDMSANALRTDLLATPIKLDAGHLILPDGPGLGVTLDRGQVERYRVC